MNEAKTQAAAFDLVVRDLGRMPYAEAHALQKELQREVIESREGAEPGPSSPPLGGSSGPACEARKMYLLLVEHDPPVITISRRKDARSNLIASDAQLQAAGVEICETDRGGDITYHGPGQLVAYPIIDLNVLGLRVHSYMRFLEQIVIDTLGEFGIEGHRDPEATGVWVGGKASRHQGIEASREEGARPKTENREPTTLQGSSLKTQDISSKICALGVRISRWVSMHGLALNVSPDLNHYDLIVPCGLAGRRVTSMKRERGEKCPTYAEVSKELRHKFRKAVEDRIDTPPSS